MVSIVTMVSDAIGETIGFIESGADLVAVVESLAMVHGSLMGVIVLSG